jgi:hypothetical protein
MTGPYLRRVAAAPAFYPASTMWLAAALVLAAAAGHILRLDVGLALLTLFAVLVILISMRREVTSVHELVNSQHDVLVARVETMADRIGQLIGALESAGVAVPHDEAGVDRG